MRPYVITQELYAAYPWSFSSARAAKILVGDMGNLRIRTPVA